MLVQLLVVTRGHEALSFKISKCIPARRYGIFPARLNDKQSALVAVSLDDFEMSRSTSCMYAVHVDITPGDGIL
jgi:hypothetical protein